MSKTISSAVRIVWSKNHKAVLSQPQSKRFVIAESLAVCLRIDDVRRHTLGYVSQFLRVIPRVPTEQVVAGTLRARGVEAGEALGRARAMLERLRIPERLWALSPVTFS